MALPATRVLRVLPAHSAATRPISVPAPRQRLAKQHQVAASSVAEVPAVAFKEPLQLSLDGSRAAHLEHLQRSYSQTLDEDDHLYQPSTSEPKLAAHVPIKRRRGRPAGSNKQQSSTSPVVASGKQTTHQQAGSQQNLPKPPGHTMPRLAHSLQMRRSSKRAASLGQQGLRQGLVRTKPVLRQTWSMSQGKSLLLKRERLVELCCAVQELQTILQLAQQVAQEQQQQQSAGTDAGFSLYRGVAQRLGVSAKEVQRRVKAGLVAQEQVVAANSGIAMVVARRFSNSGVDVGDLYMEGLTALRKAAATFDASRQLQFSTWAFKVVQQGVSRYAQRNGSVIQLPYGVAELQAKVRKVERSLTQQLQRVPSTHELADKLGIPADRLYSMRKTVRPPASLDATSPGNPDDALLDAVAAPSEAMLAPSMQRQFRGDLEAALDSLPVREALLLRLRYGLDNGVPKTLRETGAAMKLSTEYVRRLEMQAMAKLKRTGRMNPVLVHLDAAGAADWGAMELI